MEMAEAPDVETEQGDGQPVLGRRCEEGLLHLVRVAEKRQALPAVQQGIDRVLEEEGIVVPQGPGFDPDIVERILFP